MIQPILWSLVLEMPALGAFLRLHWPRAITLALRILDIVRIYHYSSFPGQLTIHLNLRSAFHSIIALNSAYQPHPHRPVLTTTSKPPPSSILMFPCRRPSIAFDAGYLGHNVPSIQHDIQVSSQEPTRLSLPYPSPEPPYHPHHRPPAQAPRLLPQSAGLCMHTVCRTCPVPAVAATQTLTSFLSQPPVFRSSHCNSSVSASYNDTEAYGVPHFEPDSTHWNSPPTPPTRSGLPVTPPDHATAAQLPPSFHPQPPKSPRPLYVPTSMLQPFSPTRTGPTFSTGSEEQFTDTQASLKSNKLSLSEGAKDVFQSLKRKRLPVAASFSRPKPRALPVKKVLPKIHGCPTCGKMFDRPSTLLVVSMVPRFSIN